MIDSTNPRIMADNIRALTDKTEGLSDAQIIQAAELVALGAYSTDEIDTGMLLGDNHIYRKIFYIENMPNNTTVSFAHNIANLGVVLYFGGAVQYASGYAGRPLPYAGTPTIRYTDTNIEVQTQNDISGNAGIIVMEYTKTSSPSNLTSITPDTRSIEPEVREEEPEAEPIEEPVKKTTTRKKTTTTE